MIHRSARLLVATGLLAIAIVAAGCTSSPASGDGKSLVERKCTRCHDTERIMAKKGDRAAWEATVARMQTKGLPLTDAEKTAILDYVTSLGK